MDPLIITATRDQRRIALGSLTLPVLLLVLARVENRLRAWEIVVVALWLLFMSLSAFGARTIVSERGIQVRRFFVTAPLRPWHEIASVRSVLTEKAEGIKVQRTNGKTFTLPVPADFKKHHDYEFDGQRDRILALWRWYAPDSGAVAEADAGAVRSGESGGVVPVERDVSPS
jgi:hypothetical protein